MLATVLELLVGMGWKHKETQTMLDRIKRTHVGAADEQDLRVEDILHPALRAAPVSGYSSSGPSSSANTVRESFAPYVRLVA